MTKIGFANDLLIKPLNWVNSKPLQFEIQHVSYIATIFSRIIAFSMGLIMHCLHSKNSYFAPIYINKTLLGKTAVHSQPDLSLAWKKNASRCFGADNRFNIVWKYMHLSFSWFPLLFYKSISINRFLFYKWICIYLIDWHHQTWPR